MNTPQNPDSDRWWLHPILFAAVQRKGHFGFCEWDYARNCTINCTPEFAAIYGMDVDELLESQSSWDKVISQMHPDDREAYASNYASQGQGNSHEIEYRIFRKDGQLRHVRETGAMLVDMDSGKNIAFSMVQDITADIERAQKLSDSVTLNNQTEAIGEFGQFIWSIEAARYTFFSPGFARIHGQSVQEFLADIGSRGEDLTDIFPADRKRVASAFKKQAKDKIDLNIEYQLIQANGRLRWVREQSTVAWDSVNAKNHIVGILQDITTHKVAENQLLEAKNTLEAKVTERTRELAEAVAALSSQIKLGEKISAQLEDRNSELERFVYTVSHELKTPLVTIKGFVGLLGKGLQSSDSSRVGQDLKQIDSAADTMAAQLKDLLEWSRKSHAIEEFTTINIGQLTHQALELHALQINQSKIKVTVNTMPDALGSASRIRELLSNLIENAIKFSGDQNSPSIEIGAVETDHGLQFFVRDNGIGIKPEYHQRVFRLFERLETNTEGTGIGLAIVKRNIESHGGKVWIESKGDNTGCTVYFSFPAAPSAE